MIYNKLKASKAMCEFPVFFTVRIKYPTMLLSFSYFLFFPYRLLPIPGESHGERMAISGFFEE